ncbi:nicotinic acid mononucleotide adenyltransferase [uncultured Maribacter sp.]|uniref:toxin-antitoxin system YwqK family antitoxin n=1 Tax=uncultured Maribacter sp. TaxID=431308 RepID=UPI00262AF5BE|nr:nicotinic acid mononucleotide adenyltransferase [uncultured Maribacter sp.]
MRNTIITLALLLISVTAFAQNKRDVKLNKETNLIEATYYHENGKVSQEGTFNLKGKLHGEWTSYNEKGEIISIGSYINGAKTGKWKFLNGDVLKEVAYTNNAIESVVEAKNTSGVVLRN